ncbi:LysM peptidoglycan-binding domain-containing protein [bacterium]|nr:MAG: LysM peptidoglycan-binding domain-containing protein [bacterium]
MPINRLTLGIVTLFAAGTTLASASYTVRNGDTLSGIADKLHVSTRSLQEANGLGKKHTLRVGMKLTVPKNHLVKLSSKKKGAANHAKVPAFDTYTVKNGDNDWTIANHAGIKLSQLHRLNPSTKWGALRVGTKINLPAGKAVAAKTPRLRSRVAVVKADDVTIRRGPSTEADAICTTTTGTRVAVLAREGAWYKLQFPKGTVGWIRGDFLKAAAPANAVHRVTTTYTAALRSKTKSKKKVTTKVAAKSRAARIAKWQKHQQNVRQRYVRRWSKQQRKYVVAPLTNGGDLIAQAESFKGVRYSWGSASRSGTDCSGFTTQVFRSAGVKLPRTSSAQSTVGNKVSRSDLSKGDLVFFRTGRGSRVTHVGIYMGNGKFIHASSGGGKVQVNNLSDNYYSNRFVTGRRVPTKSTAKAAETKSAE